MKFFDEWENFRIKYLCHIRSTNHYPLLSVSELDVSRDTSNPFKTFSRLGWVGLGKSDLSNIFLFFFLKSPTFPIATSIHEIGLRLRAHISHVSQEKVKRKEPNTYVYI